MSQASLSAARKRRAPASVSNNAPTVGRGQVPVPSAMSPPTSAPSQMNAGQGLTLAQVITLVDKRLTVLETHMKENVDSRANPHTAVESAVPSNITEVLDEFNERFEALADELANLKNVVLSLQSYTMDVNKTLLQERIRILGEDHSSAPISTVSDNSHSNWESEASVGR